MNLTDLIRKIKYEVLTYPYNDLVVAFCNKTIEFRLFDSEEVVIIYDKEKEDIYLFNECSSLGNLDYDTLKDVVNVMEVLIENKSALKYI